MMSVSSQWLAGDSVINPAVLLITLIAAGQTALTGQHRRLLTSTVDIGWFRRHTGSHRAHMH